MDDAESVGHEGVGQSGQLRSERGPLGLVLARLAGVEPDVFQQGDVTLGEAGDDGLGRRPHRVGGEGDRPAEQLAHPADDRSQRVFLLGGTLGPPEVGAHNDACTRLGQRLDGRHRRPDPAVVGDIAVTVERDIEIRTDEDALTAQVAQVGSGLHGTNLLSSGVYLNLAGQSLEPTRRQRSTRRLL